MVKIGLLSDTHSYWDDRYLKYFEDCDEIWHAGDIGSLDIIEKLEKKKKTRVVYGNIDNYEIQMQSSLYLLFQIEGLNVYMTHIGGYPGKYAKDIKQILKINKVDLFVTGHSHILKIMYDKSLDCMYINPGAAGKYGFHQIRTLIRFTIDKKELKDLEIIELKD